MANRTKSFRSGTNTVGRDPTADVAVVVVMLTKTSVKLKKW